jgi:hypothetical protein
MPPSRRCRRWRAGEAKCRAGFVGLTKPRIASCSSSLLQLSRWWRDRGGVDRWTVPWGESTRWPRERWMSRDVLFRTTREVGIIERAGVTNVTKARLVVAEGRASKESAVCASSSRTYAPASALSPRRCATRPTTAALVDFSADVPRGILGKQRGVSYGSYGDRGQTAFTWCQSQRKLHASISAGWRACSARDRERTIRGR